MQSQSKQHRVLSVFSLVMINVIAVDNLRSLPISAEYGFSLVFFYLLAAICFFIPSALVAAELATGWPMTGGAYVWMREAFGKRFALTGIWLQWIYNVVWYPTMMAFLAGIFAYLIDPSLVNNKAYMVSAVLVMFWFTTMINCFGMKVSSVMSNIGALFGTIIPMLFICVLGIIWMLMKHPVQVSMNFHHLFPNLRDWHNLSFLTAVFFGLIGMEMSAVHAEEVRNPQRDYPRALLYSTVIILISLILASLAIAIVVPVGHLSLVAGMIQAFDVFFAAFHILWMGPVIALLIMLGGLSGVSAWVIGPTKSLLVASEDGSIPPLFQKTTQEGVPINLLLLQGLIVTLISFVFLFLPSVNASYWLLTALTAQLALLYYIFLFTAAIKLRHSHADVPRSYKVPGGKVGMWCVASLGILACILVISFGFVPPEHMNVGSIWFYRWFLAGGIIISLVVPMLIYRCRKSSWGNDFISSGN